MILDIQKSETEGSSGLTDNFGISKEEFTIEVIKNNKVEKTLKDENIDFSELEKLFNNIEDERFI